MVAVQEKSKDYRSQYGSSFGKRECLCNFMAIHPNVVEFFMERIWGSLNTTGKWTSKWTDLKTWKTCDTVYSQSCLVRKSLTLCNSCAVQQEPCETHFLFQLNKVCYKQDSVQ